MQHSEPIASSFLSSVGYWTNGTREQVLFRFKSGTVVACDGTLAEFTRLVRRDAEGASIGAIYNTVFKPRGRVASPKPEWMK